MAKNGVYTNNVHSLEQVNERIKRSSEAMASIDAGVVNFFNDVGDTLERQLHCIQTKLEEAEANLHRAESELSYCYSCQYYNRYGNLVPSCSSEKKAVIAARKEVEKWSGNYELGKHIYDEFQQEIIDYQSVGHQHVLNMCEQQTHKASQFLRNCIDKLHDMLNTNVIELQWQK